MKHLNKGEKKILGYLVGLLLLGFAFMAGSGMKLPSFNIQADNQGVNTPIATGTSPGFATSLTTGAVNFYDGSTVPTLNAYVYADSDSPETWSLGETAISTVPDDVSTSAPLSFKGQLFVGNDNGQGTDRGDEYYFTKVSLEYPLGVTKHEIRPKEGGWIKVYKESAVTFSTWDSKTAETPVNITVTAGESNTDLLVEIKADAEAAIGNPEFTRPIGICANATTDADWEIIKPTESTESFKRPDYLRSYGIVGDCWVLNTGAITNSQNYEFTMLLDAADAQNPDASDYVFLFVVDKTYVIDDNQNLVEAWGDDSLYGTDQDPGIASSTTNILYVALN